MKPVKIAMMVLVLLFLPVGFEPLVALLRGLLTA